MAPPLTRPARLALSLLVLLGAVLVLVARKRAGPAPVDELDVQDQPTDPPRHHPLLVWSTWYGRTDFWEGRRIDYCGTGKPACVATHDRNKLPHSEVVLIHNADYNAKDLPPRQKGKPWVVFGRDAPIDNPWQTDAQNMRQFDLSMTHRTDSDFPIPWFSRPLVDEALRPLNEKRIRGKFSRWYDLPPIVWAENDCTAPNKYPALVRELNKHMPVHSYGECVNTLPAGRDLAQAEDHVRMIEPYKFALITEYANCDGFVQDKLMRAFRAGVVPVVDGPRNYSAIAPTPKAVIHVDDFPNLAALAAYLTRAANNRTLYLEHLDYRQNRTNVSPAWRKYWGSIMDRGEWSGWCRLCNFAVRRQFAHLRRAFPDRQSFVRAFRYRLSDQMTWHDADPRQPPSPHVLAFLNSIPDPAPADSAVVDRRDPVASIRSEFTVQFPDQSCVAGKWAALDVKQKIEKEKAALLETWHARDAKASGAAKNQHDESDAAAAPGSAPSEDHAAGIGNERHARGSWMDGGALL
ncbi:hypothetical protein H9P43_002488 [Blastocladiella emersonii ATCC 22665]|nr:hypothetical protein H9P43_002488 [Blastocladiella emersonii ATCC 22665]